MQRGNEVTLFCAPGSTSSAQVVTLLDGCHPDEIERSLYEVDHVARAFAAIDRGVAPGMAGFDVVHDHCGFTALAMADRLGTPLVHTLHGQFTLETAAFYERHAHKATLVAISRAAACDGAGDPERRGGDPQSDRRAALAATGAEGELPVLDRPHDGGEGAAPRDRGGAHGGGAAGAGRGDPTRPAGVLP